MLENSLLCWKKSGVEYRAARECLSVDKIIKYVGEGFYSSIYSTCFGGNCNLVTKFIPLDVEIPFGFSPFPSKGKLKGKIESTQEFIEEARVSKEMGELGIGPKVYDWHICEKVRNDAQGEISVGVITMEKFGKDLESYIYDHEETYEGGVSDHEQKRIHGLVMKKIEKLHKSGYDHADLHFKNILVSVDEEDKVTKVALIDFGLMKSYDDTKSKTIYHFNFDYWETLEDAKAEAKLKAEEKYKQKEESTERPTGT